MKDVMKSVFLLMILALATSPLVHADYAIPQKLEQTYPELAVVDATVTKITKEGYAELKVHQTLKAAKKPIKVIKGVWLSCTPGPPKIFGMEQGKRYLILLNKDLLYEEASYFLISVKKGERGCSFAGVYAKWFDSKNQWMSLTACEQRLKAAQASLKASSK